MNKQKGNMYPFVSHTWNPIRGKCPHDCIYCYMKVYPQPELHLDEKILSEDLGQGNFIFVGSSTDMWADAVPNGWIKKVLNHCIYQQSDNRYLFQTKNPSRFNGWNFPGVMKSKTILGITLESNRCWSGTKAPCPVDRYYAFKEIHLPKMVSIEPIMDFDLDILVGWIKDLKPEFVSIGADSKGHNLPEPSSDKVIRLIRKLTEITEVKEKDNLMRLVK